MDRIVVETELTAGDWRAYYRAAIARTRSERIGWSAVPILAVLATMVALMLIAGLPYMTSFAVGAIAAAVAVVVLLRTGTTADGWFVGPYRLELLPDGLHEFRPLVQTHTEWSCVRGVSVSATHLFIWIGRTAGYVVPRRALPPDVTPDALTAFVREHTTSTFGVTRLSDEAIASDGAPRDDTTSVNWAIAASIVVALGIWCAFDYWSARPDPAWYGNGVTGLSWYALCALLLAGAVTQLVKPHLSFARTLSIVVAPLPIVTLALAAITMGLSAPASTWAFVAIGIALLVYLGARLRLLHVPRVAATVFSAFIVSSLLVFATQHIYVSTELWYPAEDEEADDEANAYNDAERILFDQPAMIDAALDRIAPSTGNQPLLYFVGFGGYGAERVFAREVRFVAAVVGARYATGERSLSLLNDDDDRESLPLATVSGLRHALRGVAAKMNVDRDVLFLFLTSHGSATPALSVSNGNLPLEQLTGAALAGALDESEIQWRVIVISACHAGAFIGPLRNERTIVLTASAAERTSFGCSDDRDLTYFGEALFRDALPTAPSLLVAFEAARNAIAEREKREGITPSAPQGYVGTEISARWRELEPTDSTARP